MDALPSRLLPALPLPEAIPLLLLQQPADRGARKARRSSTVQRNPTVHMHSDHSCQGDLPGPTGLMMRVVCCLPGPWQHKAAPSSAARWCSGGPRRRGRGGGVHPALRACLRRLAADSWGRLRAGSAAQSLAEA